MLLFFFTIRYSDSSMSRQERGGHKPSPCYKVTPTSLRMRSEERSLRAGCPRHNVSPCGSVQLRVKNTHDSIDVATLNIRRLEDVFTRTPRLFLLMWVRWDPLGFNCATAFLVTLYVLPFTSIAPPVQRSEAVFGCCYRRMCSAVRPAPRQPSFLSTVAFTIAVTRSRHSVHRIPRTPFACRLQI